MTPSRLAFIRHMLEHPEEYPANPLAVELLAYVDDLRADHESAVHITRTLYDNAPRWMKRPNCPGSWATMPSKEVPTGIVLNLTQERIDDGAPFYSDMVYGPIPEPPA